MSEQELRTPAVVAIVLLAEIKSATHSFDSGQVNVFDALDTIMSAIESYRHAKDVHRSAA